ncbi:unnamed protein product [Blepharisma stoltei]|uniref:ATP-dependent RNA helicase n=1 Tax=Blepharisma stoltei TaxID=1481888 RepID=A0AAU9JNM5_9CILI|nr:unnamed protein product [Blepharisma stoltei]
MAADEAETKWEDLIDSSEMIEALKSNNMNEPTDIQRSTLKQSCKFKQDLIISAKTGSGKTLCFAIPILLSVEKTQETQAIIVSPTRELCLQITAHLNAINYKKLDIQCLIGGIAREKQERLLNRHPQILVGTPGRLWEFICDRQNDVVRDIAKAKFLVIDEADRMIEMGHFKELRLILNYIYDPSSVAKESIEVEGEGPIQDLNFNLEGDMIEEFLEEEKNDKKKKEEKKKNTVKRQTFLISATMTIENQARKVIKPLQGPNKKKDNEETVVDKLKKLVQFRGKPVVVDLTQKEQLPSELTEYKISCNDEEKESLLHYLLKEFENKKTIIFANTIKQERRIIEVLKLLGHSVLRLDGKMPQRDRFKRLEKFQQGGYILIATDVAGRGLDLPEVGLIIHFSLPKTAENYIHRCGRTARIYHKGTSIVLVGPSDVRSLRTIQTMLGRDILNYHCNLEEWKRAEHFVKIAKEVSHIENSHQIGNKQSSWEQKVAEEAGLDTEAKMEAGPRKKLKFLKKQLEQSKAKVEVPMKRTSVITPELFQMAKQQKLI